METPESRPELPSFESRIYLDALVARTLEELGIDRDLSAEVATEIARGYGDLRSRPYLSFLAGVSYGSGRSLGGP